MTEIAELTTAADVLGLLLPPDPDKDTQYRVSRFADWMREKGRPWHKVDLRAYRDAMLSEEYARSTVSAHLSTVRARYRDLLTDDTTRDALYDRAAAQLARLGLRDTPADRKAFVDEMQERLDNALDPSKAKVEREKVQDEVDSDHIRLTQAQSNALLAAPGVDTPQGLRDTALIALALCTGLREAELVALEVADLRQEAGGELGVHVREGKGAKTRFVPYGDLDFCLVVVDRWLAYAGIEDGPVFRGFWRGGRKVRPTALTTRAVQMILEQYPLSIGGEMRSVNPHDLRRTYARLQWEAGVPIVAIQQNLGHADINTTILYIGALDMDTRRARAVYTFDLSALDNLIL